MWLSLFLYSNTMSGDLDDIKNNMCALEYFLQDKKDHKELCPEIKWEQPKLEKYKKDPKSHLPKECKEDEDN